MRETADIRHVYAIKSNVPGIADTIVAADTHEGALDAFLRTPLSSAAAAATTVTRKAVRITGPDGVRIYICDAEGCWRWVTLDDMQKAWGGAHAVASRTLAVADVVQQLRAECEAVGSQEAWAQAHDLSPAYVSDVLSGRRDPGESVLAALGLERVVSYRRSQGGGQ